MEQILSQFLEVVSYVEKRLVDVVKQIFEALKAIEKRSKWRRTPPTPIRPLLLDKRSKIHRCRNAI